MSIPAFATVSATASVVPVAKFRDAVEHVERLLTVDRHACVTAGEVAQWRDRLRAAGADLIATTCKRALMSDWERRERAIDRSASVLAAVAS